MPRRGGRRKKSRTHAAGSAGSAASGGGRGGGADATAPQGAANALVENQEAKVPKSLVLRRGKTAREVGELVDDLRHLMMPYTALHFQEDAKNRKLTLRQYCQNLALPMGISHIMAFSQNQSNGRLNLRLARTPEGPTLHFHVHQFSLSKHIKALQKRPVANTAALQANPPLVVTNNFGAATATTASGSSDNVPPHVKLMRITFQNLFPAINVATVKLADCRRVVMFHLLTETVPVSDNQEDGSSAARDGGGEPQKTQERQIVQMRHYAVKRTPVGVNRKVRRIVERKKKLPNLHKVNDIADYVSGNAVVSDGAPSDSEFEDNLDDDGDDKQGEGGGEGDDRSAASSSHQSSTGGSAAAVVEVATGGGRMQKSAIKLVEIGPRLSLELFKVEKGLGGGNDKNNEDVLYHAHVQKTPAEVAEIRQRQRDEASRKEERRATQDANVQRKRKALEEKREQKRQRKEEKQQAAMQALREGRPIEQEQEAAAADDDDGSRDNDGSDEDSEAS